jgi:hypothetical protein
MGYRSYQVPRNVAFLILPLMLAAAALWVHFAPPAKPAEAPRLARELPAKLGSYESSLILHCQNERCLQAHPVKAVDDLVACPACGSPLLPMSFAERTVLPADTAIARRTYQSPGSPAYTVTIVLAGADPRSIHRPQQCLPAQGYSIDRQSLERLDLGSGRRLEVVRIDSRRGPDPRSRFGFVYWFAGADRLTASHFVRLAWTLRDQLFFNKTSRWAYVAVTIGEPLESPESRLRLAAFLKLLLPAIETPAPEPS